MRRMMMMRRRTPISRMVQLVAMWQMLQPAAMLVLLPALLQMPTRRPLEVRRKRSQLLQKRKGLMRVPTRRMQTRKRGREKMRRKRKRKRRRRRKRRRQLTWLLMQVG